MCFPLIIVELFKQNTKEFSRLKVQQLFPNRFSDISGGFFLLSGHVASAPGLETDDDVCDLHVPLLF